MPTNKVTALKSTHLFANLNDRILAEIASYAVLRQLQPGQVLFSEHEEALSMYIVVQGELRSIRQNASGREQVLSTEGPGAILAVAPVFNGGAFYSTLIADSAAEVLGIERNDMRQLCNKHTELLWNVGSVLAHKIRHYANLIETLALRNVDQRVAQHLFSLCQKSTARKGNECQLKLETTRSEMASRVGSTREVVSRALAHLQRKGLIQMTKARLLTVPDVDALGKFATADQKIEKPRLVSDLSSELA